MNAANDVQSLADAVSEMLPVTSTIALGELTLVCQPADIVRVLTKLRDRFAFHILIDVCGADWPAREKRFDVVYHLLSTMKNARLRVKLQVGEGEAVPSACEVFSSANWYEREVYDFYGVEFSGHPDMRRILTDYGFEGHPLRKDFPLSGHVELRYDDDQKKVVYRPVELVQEYRDFDFESPWEGMLNRAKD